MPAARVREGPAVPPAADRVAAAKLWLISEQAAHLPYLAQALYALVTVESSAVERVVADRRWRLYVNPAWVVEVDAGALARAIAHQLWHLLLEHADRAAAAGIDAASRHAWHAAADLAIADTLASSGGSVLAGELVERVAALRVGRPQLAPGKAAEEYWLVLRKTLPPPEAPDPREGDDGDEGSAADGQDRSWELPEAADVGGLTEIEAGVVRQRVAIDYRAHKGERGDTPGEFGRWLRRMTEPTLPWETLLAQAVRRGVGWTSGRTHTTYTRPNRRAASTPGVVLPGWRRPQPQVACVVDTSGSVDDALLARAMSEVEGALRQLGAAVDVLACDAAVHAVTRVRKASDAALMGGGGTDLRVALAAVEQLRPRPTLTVVFTDGWTPWPETPPAGSAVVVALLVRHGEETLEVPAWATVVRCELDD